MWQANLVIVSLKKGVLLREGQHGDRILVEHDGTVIVNTLPSDIVVTIGDDAKGAAMIKWAEENLKEFRYVHDFTNKEITVTAIDKYNNAIGAKLDAATTLDEFLDFVTSKDVDNLSIRSNKRIEDYAKLIFNVESLKKAIAAAAKEN